MNAPTADHYEISGKRYIRVTSFLRAVGAASDFSGIPERDREFYMARGTANHDLWQKVEEGVADQYEFDARVEAYRAGHAQFLRDTGFRALPGGIEMPVHATWEDLGFKPKGDLDGIAGTLDRLGTIQNRVVLIDYKTNDAPSSTNLQTALYLLLNCGYAFNEVERYGVGIRPNGTYRMSEKYSYRDKAEALGLIDKYLKETK